MPSADSRKPAVWVTRSVLGAAETLSFLATRLPLQLSLPTQVPVRSNAPAARGSSTTPIATTAVFHTRIPLLLHATTVRRPRIAEASDVVVSHSTIAARPPARASVRAVGAARRNSTVPGTFGEGRARWDTLT